MKIDIIVAFVLLVLCVALIVAKPLVPDDSSIEDMDMDEPVLSAREFLQLLAEKRGGGSALLIGGGSGGTSHRCCLKKAWFVCIKYGYIGFNGKCG